MRDTPAQRGLSEAGSFAVRGAGAGIGRETFELECTPLELAEVEARRGHDLAFQISELLQVCSVVSDIHHSSVVVQPVLPGACADAPHCDKRTVPELCLKASCNVRRSEYKVAFVFLVRVERLEVVSVLREDVCQTFHEMKILGGAGGEAEADEADEQKGDNHCAERERDCRVELGADFPVEVRLQRRPESLLKHRSRVRHHAYDVKMGLS
eukprot:290697-Rhodomonas_salina.2